MSRTLFRKAQGLLEFIDQRPLRAHVVTYLSENFSLDDHPCAVGVTQLGPDGTLHSVAARGFIEHDPMTAQIHNINSDRPTSTALREQKLAILNVEQMSRFLEFLPDSDRNTWSTGVTIPIGMPLMYFFFLKEDATAIDGYFDYISMVSAILNRFESELLEDTSRTGANWFRGEALALTERESQIEVLIRQGLTNAEIAQQLGYSESLIRQETVVIYRKLGVKGRKELIPREVRSSHRYRKSIQAVVGMSGIESMKPVMEVLEHSQYFII